MTTTAQQEAFKSALVAGYYRDLAIYSGGTGHLRKELSSKEYSRRKKRRQLVKASRKANR